MKKNILFFTAYIFTLGIWAQNTEFVNQAEFQEKSKLLKTQVSAVRNSNLVIKKNQQEISSNISEINLAIKELRKVDKTFLDSINKTNTTSTQTINNVNRHNSQLNILTIALIFVFILSIIFSFSVFFRLDKLLKKIKIDVDNNKNTIFEHAKNQEKKISELSHELSKMEAANKTLEAEISKINNK